MGTLLAVSAPPEKRRCLGVIAVSSNKGGVGKTTLATNLAIYLRALRETLPVAVVRTDPAHNGREGVREVEALYLDTIASAQRYLYFENQYVRYKDFADLLRTTRRRLKTYISFYVYR